MPFHVVLYNIANAERNEKCKYFIMEEVLKKFATALVGLLA